MVKTCCVYSCRSESYGGCHISFHIFPKNEELRQKWLNNVIIRQKITKNSLVCSRHFEDSCFYYTNSRQLLKRDAIPTISPDGRKLRISPTSDITIQQPHSTSAEVIRIDPLQDKSNKHEGVITIEPLANSTFTFTARTNASVAVEHSVKIANSNSTVEKPCLNVKEVGVQTEPAMCPIQDDLKREIKVLKQKLKRRDERIKKNQQLTQLFNKKFKQFEVNEIIIRRKYGMLKRIIRKKNLHLKGRICQKVIQVPLVLG